MATYYVRPDGNDANSGLGPAVNQAWASITKAIGATGIAPGDTLYIAPGFYRGVFVASFTNPINESQRISILGDPAATQFSGVIPGPVVITNYLSDNSNPSGVAYFTCNKSFITVKNIRFDGSQLVIFQGANYLIEKCCFVQSSHNVNGGTNCLISSEGNNPINATVNQCVFVRGGGGLTFGTPSTGASFNTNCNVTNSIFLMCSPGITFNGGTGGSGLASNCVGNGGYVYNCLGLGVEYLLYTFVTNADNTVYLYNSICMPYSAQGVCVRAQSFASTLIENYNRFISTSPRINVSVGANTTSGISGIDFSQFLLTTGVPYSWFAPYLSSPLINAGTSSGAPTTDFYGKSWTLGTDIGPFARTNFSSVSSYLPLERQVESFTVSPNTSNRTELIYLGAKGLTHTTPSLSASYVRAGAIRTAITLVSQTPNGSWTSGGFCEIDSVNMPGIYRIDVPNALFVAGAESAMLQITGTNQTNGAVVHYNMAKVQFDLSQNVPLTNTAHSIGDALNAARAQGFGKWQIVGNTMNIYAEDGITLVKSFALDSGSYPTQRM